MTGLATVAVVIGISRQQAARARDRAQAEARRADANTLLALGRAELDRYPLASLAYARKSLEVADTPGGRRLAVDALWRSPAARILPLGEHVSWVNDISPDGRWLAGYAFDGHLVLVPDDGGPMRAVPGPPVTGLVPLIRFRPDGKAVFTHDPQEAVIRVWDVPGGRAIGSFAPEPPGGAWPPSLEPREGFTGGFTLRFPARPDGLQYSWWPAAVPSRAETWCRRRRHGVEVRPVDVDASEWDCTLERCADSALALRLGLRLARGFPEAAAANAVNAVGAMPRAIPRSSAGSWICFIVPKGEGCRRVFSF